MQQEKKMTYLERRSMTEDQIDQVDLQLENAQNKLQLESDILVTQSEVMKAEARLSNLKSAQVLSANDIISAQNELEGLTSGLKAIQALMKELFPTK